MEKNVKVHQHLVMKDSHNENVYYLDKFLFSD